MSLIERLKKLETRLRALEDWCGYNDDPCDDDEEGENNVDDGSEEEEVFYICSTLKKGKISGLLPPGRYSLWLNDRHEWSVDKDDALFFTDLDKAKFLCGMTAPHAKEFSKPYVVSSVRGRV